MENREVPKSEPLSYEASKAVLKSLSLKTRESINRRIPELRTINSRLPYVLNVVAIEDDTFETNGTRWRPTSIYMKPSKSVVAILQVNPFKGPRYRVNKSREEVLEQLFDEYIRDGTVDRALYICGIPEFMKRRIKNKIDSKMKVTNLQWRTSNTEDYENFIQFIDLDVLESVSFYVFGDSPLEFLDKPEIQTCKKLTVSVISCYGSQPTNSPVDQLLRLRNQRLQLEYYLFTLHELQLFVQDWITTGREIGTSFSWAQKRSEDVADILEHLKTHFGAIEAKSNLKCYFSNKTIDVNCITVKMGQDRELRMFCEEIYFEMKVVAITTAASTVPAADI
ncbi:hypothetical protein CRE_29061 [Caenorhabditis remanei]|uniref:F-box associated domain-containing protein n=1 Tax=Caenorhabditis remanei TaxID=31234 RepID=E3MWC0_CAERE|nr:hypothetical protein CRE_29061 [Caenorhabditis remanei]